MSNHEKSKERPTTQEWAENHGISIAPNPPPVPDYDEPCPFTARQIATRAIILQCVVAVACEVDPEPVVEWLKEQGVWEEVSPDEQGFLLAPDSFDRGEWVRLRWRQEAEWTLLWVIGKVESLGLPTRQCDTRLMINEIIPELGSDIEPFLESAEIRPAGLLLAENSRHYDLWCQYFQTRRMGPQEMPVDLDFNVLHQRQYVFEWLQGTAAWDDVQCDS